MEINIVSKDYRNKHDLYIRTDNVKVILNLTRPELKELKEEVDRAYGNRDNGKSK